MASSHTSASAEVLRWLLSLGGKREMGSESKGQRGWRFGGVYWHTDKPHSLSKSNMQTPAFREINTLQQTAKSASGG